MAWILALYHARSRTVLPLMFLVLSNWVMWAGEILGRNLVTSS